MMNDRRKPRPNRRTPAERITIKENVMTRLDGYQAIVMNHAQSRPIESMEMSRARQSLRGGLGSLINGDGVHLTLMLLTLMMAMLVMGANYLMTQSEIQRLVTGMEQRAASMAEMDTTYQEDLVRVDASGNALTIRYRAGLLGMAESAEPATVLALPEGMTHYPPREDLMDMQSLALILGSH